MHGALLVNFSVKIDASYDPPLGSYVIVWSAAGALAGCCGGWLAGVACCCYTTQLVLIIK